MKSMKNLFKIVLLSLCLCGFHGAIAAAEKGTAEEAVAMVKKAKEFIKKNGKEKAFAEFNNPGGQFVQGDLYVMVYDMEGLNKAHGGNPRLIGKNLLDIKDANGVFIVKSFIEVATTKGKGWVDYKWFNKVSNAVEPKSTYVEKHEDVLVGVGIYK
ncbi:cache domain-containing protein [Pseudoduganella namucuonensis]|uniref:Single Cache domain 2-containing protein n=1 Tax=Pseudoduganella namucuonensis TaxID=1035707 RepID=A0A1I7M195_9BURK|nr:cache domain-containing protein [Pseudoduganella namucuonensis]SFV15607.1 Single Cache domain 2-containing protein [Pseudoduganella namucuonensis]